MTLKFSDDAGDELTGGLSTFGRSIIGYPLFWIARSDSRIRRYTRVQLSGHRHIIRQAYTRPKSIKVVYEGLPRLYYQSPKEETIRVLLNTTCSYGR